ncbi:hypothetical protein LEP1GSC151_5241 [Leptospira interrogans serovar Grippotyphosa str. LT2186]|uniref:Uncharacterized protein n=1 Tax=Leptospira interrogans serovar Grippotyphosa str. LT2186 TaxID=1001599 RepID=M3HE06_LEPIR|nr:hypothetical protein LEP1GSC151_5241 [Leptospira interrogans serovar Grippotyphosa str. LT2186]
MSETYVNDCVSVNFSLSRKLDFRYFRISAMCTSNDSFYSLESTGIAFFSFKISNILSDMLNPLSSVL